MQACQEHPNRPNLSQNHSAGTPPDWRSPRQRPTNVTGNYPLQDSARSIAVTEDRPRYQDRPTKNSGIPKFAVMERILSWILREGSYQREMNARIPPWLVLSEGPRGPTPPLLGEIGHLGRQPPLSRKVLMPRRTCSLVRVGKGH